MSRWRYFSDILSIHTSCDHHSDQCYDKKYTEKPLVESVVDHRRDDRPSQSSNTQEYIKHEQQDDSILRIVHRLFIG